MGYLRKAHCGITYIRPDANCWIMPNFAEALRKILYDIPERDQSRASTPWALDDLLGTSVAPRRLPPGNELKIVAHTNVEDIFFLPSREITEIELRQMIDILDEVAVETGCPYCRAPLAEMFFYIYGLERLPPGSIDIDSNRPHARCQRCGRGSSLTGKTLFPQ